MQEGDVNKMYRETKSTMSWLQYHFVFCPRYRRKIFKIPGVEERFRELTEKECQKHEIEIIEMKCGCDYVYMYVNASPKMSPTEIMKCVKSATSWTLREEFEKISNMPSLWTLSFLVSTEPELPQEVIQKFINKQKMK